MWLQVIYTSRKNTYQAYKSDVAREIGNSMYTCGNSLFQSGHELEHVVVVRLAMTCTSTIERQYYKAGFATLCCYCADAEVATTPAALSMTYEFVYPTCKVPCDIARADVQEKEEKDLRLRGWTRAPESKDAQDSWALWSCCSQQANFQEETRRDS